MGILSSLVVILMLYVVYGGVGGMRSGNRLEWFPLHFGSSISDNPGAKSSARQSSFLLSFVLFSPSFEDQRDTSLIHRLSPRLFDDRGCTNRSLAVLSIWHFSPPAENGLHFAECSTGIIHWMHFCAMSLLFSKSKKKKIVMWSCIHWQDRSPSYFRLYSMSLHDVPYDWKKFFFFFWKRSFLHEEESIEV